MICLSDLFNKVVSHLPFIAIITPREKRSSHRSVVSGLHIPPSSTRGTCIHRVPAALRPGPYLLSASLCMCNPRCQAFRSYRVRFRETLSTPATPHSTRLDHRYGIPVWLALIRRNGFTTILRRLHRYAFVTTFRTFTTVVLSRYQIAQNLSLSP